MRRCKNLGSLNSFLSYAPQLSGANPVSLFTLLLAFPQLLSNQLASGIICWIIDWEAHIHIWRLEIAFGCDISCLLIWQETFSFLTTKPARVIGQKLLFSEFLLPLKNVFITEAETINIGTKFIIRDTEQPVGAHIE